MEHWIKNFTLFLKVCTSTWPWGSEYWLRPSSGKTIEQGGTLRRKNTSGNISNINQLCVKSNLLNGGGRKSSMDTNISGQRFEEKHNIYIVSTFISPNYLLIWKGQEALKLRKQALLTQVIKVTITNNRANWRQVAPDTPGAHHYCHGSPAQNAADLIRKTQVEGRAGITLLCSSKMLRSRMAKKCWRTIPD